MIWWTEKDMIYLPPMIKLEYLKKIRVRWIILAILLISVWIVMGNPRLGEWYSRSIYPWVSGMLSRFSCLFPFSVGDCFIYGSIAGLLGYLSYAIIRRRRIGRTIRHVVEYLMANGLEIPYNHIVDYHKQNDYSSRVLYLEEVK